MPAFTKTEENVLILCCDSNADKGEKFREFWNILSVSH